MSGNQSFPSTLHTPPPSQIFAILQFPQPYTLLMIFNRPRHLNSTPSSVHHDMHNLLAWYDNEPSLRVAIVTGLGRAFCAGADLKEWNEHNAARAAGRPGIREAHPPSGFGGLSRRVGRKPAIGAINGLAYGGGFEMVANLDLAVACKSATFALSEVKIGVVASGGALPRLARTVGRVKAMDIALTGRVITAEEGERWGFLNCVTDDHADLKSERVQDVIQRPVVKKALEYAALIVGNSPDSVVVTKAGVNAGWEDGSVENATRVQDLLYAEKVAAGENMREGVLSFAEKRKPKWKDSKL